jgi:hypothetical protein
MAAIRFIRPQPKAPLGMPWQIPGAQGRTGVCIDIVL